LEWVSSVRFHPLLCWGTHYEQIADAPDAIARLRRFILDLAVRGKLVPQDPSDEPASELLKRRP
jgi:type I restriction enzyme, S subunit